MTKLKPLNHKHLRRSLDSSTLDFKTTNEIKTLTEYIGQDRALDALEFGIGIKNDGYNLYAMGPTGIGKRSLIKTVLQNKAARMPVPPDWCYVNNFAAPDKPIALKLPHGKGFVFKQDMKEFIADTASTILTVFESDEYGKSLNKIRKYYDKRRERREDKSSLLFKIQHIKEAQLQRRLIGSAIKSAVRRLRKKYEKYKSVQKYLTAVHESILDNVNDFIIYDEKTSAISLSPPYNPALIKYKVNLLVDNKKKKSAPVVFEENPTYSNLICRIEHIPAQGVPTTNFSLIKAGSLHLANGGYLIIEARKLRKNAEAYEALKTMLYAKKILIKPTEQDTRLLKPVSMDPVPIPLDVKVILIGNRNNYYSLCENDPDFIELFKVPVDFSEQINRNRKNIDLYTRLIATIAKKYDLLPFHATAVAEIIDYSSRLAEDVEKLSTQIRDIQDLILEANYWASLDHKKMVRSPDIKHAIFAKTHRMDRSREVYYQDIKRDFIIINTSGKTIGQVNCLSVRRVGDFSYGHPTRVTARVRLGKGKMIDIQREINMAGPMHSKASLTIASFLASRFNQDEPFALTASLSFEQIYCMTDGDSASVGELCALLSSLAEVPVFQNYAITGSIDQYGEVQAVGGLNEKIEGFYDICNARGLKGNHGVIIPAVNVTNLMLREDIVQAAKDGKFSIYPVNNIDEAIAQLTGWEPGKRNKSGNFSVNTIYFRIEKRLKELVRHRRVVISE